MKNYYFTISLELGSKNEEETSKKGEETKENERPFNGYTIVSSAFVTGAFLLFMHYVKLL